ncbi:hypothetical protein BC941DRAFT_90492 [Chlamydoabsidia padenii]|nr:hypothetical protein BC941DRAFT_90492 [Chlamydoabsidia padenii]
MKKGVAPRKKKLVFLFSQPDRDLKISLFHLIQSLQTMVSLVVTPFLQPTRQKESCHKKNLAIHNISSFKPHPSGMTTKLGHDFIVMFLTMTILPSNLGNLETIDQRRPDLHERRWMKSVLSLHMTKHTPDSFSKTLYHIHSFIETEIEAVNYL